MSDIKISWQDSEEVLKGDWIFENNDMQLDEGFSTAVFISIFTDRRAADDDVLPAPNGSDKRGFWGDSIDPYEDGDQIGSRLWLLERSQTTEKVISQAEDYILESLEWMKVDGWAESISVDAERQTFSGGARLAFRINIGLTEKGQQLEKKQIEASKAPAPRVYYYVLITEDGSIVITEDGYAIGWSTL